jgi:spore germination protein KA
MISLRQFIKQRKTEKDNELIYLTDTLDKNIHYLKQLFNNCSDIVYREFNLAQCPQIKLVLIYADGLADNNIINQQIIKPLVLEVSMTGSSDDITNQNAFHYIKTQGLCINQVKEVTVFNDVVNAVLSGDTVLLVEGHDQALTCESKGWKSRSVEESTTEAVVRGPKESFVETLRINTALIRRKVKNPRLKIEMFKIGHVTKTDVAVVYIEGIAKENIVNEVKDRLRKIAIDDVLDSGYIEQLIEDHPYSPFPTINNTDRPDKTSANLLEGKVAILVDGTPVVLTVPAFFVEAIQSPEDYYQKFQFVSLIRIVRFFSLVATLLAPSLYIAVISYHQEMLPTPLMLSIAAQREAVPLPVLLEVFFMEIAFEILREAGIRLPKPVGQAVSIVGALIIGEAAVQAGLVAAATVIVVALTGIASFNIYYSSSLALRFLRFPLMFATAFLGLFGLVSAVFIMVIHLAAMRSFGIPYLTPLAPTTPGGLKDTLVRAPFWHLVKRPHLISQKYSRGKTKR